MIHRRSFLAGLFSAFAAPAIVRAEWLMPVRNIILPETAIIRPRPLVLGVPRCDICFGPFGMCAHSGGPMNLVPAETARRLDSRVVEELKTMAWNARRSA